MKMNNFFTILVTIPVAYLRVIINYIFVSDLSLFFT